MCTFVCGSLTLKKKTNNVNEWCLTISKLAEWIVSVSKLITLFGVLTLAFLKEEMINIPEITFILYKTGHIKYIKTQ